MTTPVHDDEQVGQTIAVKRKAQTWREARPGEGPPVLPAREGDPSISADRLSKAGYTASVSLGIRRHNNNGRRDPFFDGWVVLPVRLVRAEGLVVRAAPTENPPNPYHTLVVPPPTCEKGIRDYSQELAQLAHWRDVADDWGTSIP